MIISGLRKSRFVIVAPRASGGVRMRVRRSCADAIFSTQEVIDRYLQGDNRVYMCLYDLQKAFDSVEVEVEVLLKRLFQAGVNSKAWRLLYIQLVQ